LRGMAPPLLYVLGIATGVCVYQNAFKVTLHLHAAAATPPGLGCSPRRFSTARGGTYNKLRSVAYKRVRRLLLQLHVKHALLGSLALERKLTETCLVHSAGRAAAVLLPQPADQLWPAGVAAGPDGLCPVAPAGGCHVGRPGDIMRSTGHVQSAPGSAPGLRHMPRQFLSITRAIL
jgi:hypothetical protein